MTDFYQPPVNLLRPNTIPETPSTPPANRHTWMYFFVLLVLLGLGFFWFVKAQLTTLPSDPTAYDPITLRPKQLGIMHAVRNFIFNSNMFLTGEENDRVNVLVLGMGGPGHDGPYLTDTIMIASIKPSTKEMALISIPRDLEINIPNFGVRKINAVNSIGETNDPGQGGEFTRKEIEKLFGISIPYYIRIDFAAFQDMVDTVGGITINVPNGFTDTSFPGPNYSYQTISFTTGEQVMDGERALNYSRSRHGNAGESSDFARSRRQQQVIAALRERILSADTYTNPATIERIMGTLASHITTNLNFGQIMYVGSIVKEVGTTVKTLVIDDSPRGFLTSAIASNGAFVLRPKSGNFSEVEGAINHVFDPTTSTPPLRTVTSNPTTTTSPIFSPVRIAVQNGTWRVGLASRLQKQLTDQGFAVPLVGNSAKRPIATTTIYVVRSAIAPEITSGIKKILPNAPIFTSLPEWFSLGYTETSTPPAPPLPDIAIIIGTDFPD